MDEREGGLLAWQLRNYDAAHQDRVNVVIHAITAPLFWAGLLALILTPRAWMVSAPLLLVAFVAQGVGHRREKRGPLPFRGPHDVVIRFVAEQLITFPRWVARRTVGARPSP
jgi:uncharacterized membrane protein YGL010W